MALTPQQIITIMNCSVGGSHDNIKQMVESVENVVMSYTMILILLVQ